MKKLFLILLSVIILLPIITVIVVNLIAQNILNTNMFKTKINQVLIEEYDVNLTYDNISLKIFDGLYLDNLILLDSNNDKIFNIDKMYLNYKITPLLSNKVIANISLENFNLKNDMNDISTEGKLNFNLNNNELFFDLDLVSQNFNLNEFNDFIDFIMTLKPETGDEVIIDEEVKEVPFYEQFIVNANINTELNNIYYSEYFNTSFKGTIVLNPLILPFNETDNISSGEIKLQIPSIVINNNKHLKKVFNNLKLSKYENKDSFKSDEVRGTINIKEGNLFIKKNEIKIEDATLLVDSKIHLTGTGELGILDKKTESKIINLVFNKWKLKKQEYNEKYLIELLKREGLDRLQQEKDKLIERSRSLFEEKKIKQKEEIIQEATDILESIDEKDIKEKVSKYIDTDTVEKIKEKVNEYNEYIDTDTIKKIEKKADELLQNEELKEKLENKLNKLLGR
jgi:hypothetical protein